MIELPVNDQYRITTDPLNWIVERGAKTKMGTTRWRAQTYHPTLEDAVNSLGNRMVRESSAKGVAEVLAQVESVRSTLLHALAGKFEVGIAIHSEVRR